MFLELQTLITPLPRLHHAMKMYISHRLRAKVQFHEIYKVNMDMKEKSSVGLIVDTN